MHRFTMVVWFVALGASAQPARAPDPADPAVRVPGARHDSGLSAFRTDRDAKVAPWKQVNEEVKGAGMQHGGGHAPGAAAQPVTATPKPADAAPAKREAAPPAHRH